MQKEWYLKTGDRIEGPFTEPEIRGRLLADAFSAGAEVRQGNSAWRSAQIVKEIFSKVYQEGWYVQVDSKLLGPFIPRKILDLHASGQLPPHALLRKGIAGPWLMVTQAIKAIHQSEPLRAKAQPGRKSDAPTELSDATRVKAVPIELSDDELPVVYAYPIVETEVTSQPRQRSEAKDSEVDLELEQAGVKARRSFGIFWREMTWEMRRIVPALDLAAIKVAFSDPPDAQTKRPGGMEVEQMWVLDVEFDGRKLQGTLINAPRVLTSYHEGDRVTISGKQLVDWMYACNGEVFGGFAIDVLRSRMSVEEREQHDEAWGFDFRDVGVVTLVPPGYIGEEEMQNQSIEKVMSVEHPMSVNMRHRIDSHFAEDLNLEQLYASLHELSLAGSYDGVDVCLKYGADAKRPAENGMTAFQLARSLGWRRVMKRLQQAGGG